MGEDFEAEMIPALAISGLIADSTGASVLCSDILLVLEAMIYIGTNTNGHRCRWRPRFKKLEEHRRRLWCTTLFVLLLILVVHPPQQTVLEIEATEYSYPAYRSASNRESLRSTIGIAEVRTAIEYEYRFTEYRFAEYEYDEIRCEERTYILLSSP
jgi:hypothetical protein